MKLRPRLFLLFIVAILLAVALAIPRLANRYRRQLQVQPAAEARWRQQIQNARQQRDALARRLEAGREHPAAMPPAADSSSQPDLAQLNETESWVRQVKRLKQLFLQHPDQSIPELALLDDRDWLSLARLVRLDPEENRRRAYAIVRNTAKSSFVQAVRQALEIYLNDNHGQLPNDTTELQPYLSDSAFDSAMLARYKMVRSGRLSAAPEGPVIEEKSIADDLFDERMHISRRPDASLTYGGDYQRRPEAPTEEEGLHDQMEYDVNLAVRAFVKANRGALPQKPTDLLPYFDPPLGPAMTAMLSRPISSEEQKLFLDDVAKRAASRARTE